jgi:ACS family glucarate transporter-like MFS transporter
LVIATITLSFFGEGVGALRWAMVSDTSPKEISGLNGGLFNMMGNSATITTPLVVGYVVAATGSFSARLSCRAERDLSNRRLSLVVGDKRLELKPV